MERNETMNRRSMWRWLPAIVAVTVVTGPLVAARQGPSGMVSEAVRAEELTHSHWQGLKGVPIVSADLDRNPAATLTFDRIVQAPTQEPQNWLTYYGNYAGTRFSSLDQINAGNVSKLQLAWQTELPIEEHGFEATPLVVDGVMYVTTGGNTRLYALDAKTGEQLWHFSTDPPQNLPICCDWVNRGAAIGYGKVYFNSIDGKLWALDAQTGKVAWSNQHAEPREGEAATVAPLLLKRMVVTGVSGGEYGIRGYIAAFDVDTGKELWRTHTTVDDGSWGGDAWITGGAPTWMTGTYDPELDILYWQTGNAAPDFNGLVRPGDNHWAAAVVALDPDDGRLLWGFQYTPHDVYDYDAIGPNILIDLPVNGTPTRALVHADKNAFFWALDRQNGKFLYAKQFARQTWAKGIDAAGRPIVDPNALPTPEMKPICPSTSGATEWNPSSFSPQTGYVYIPVIEQCGTYRLSQAFFQRSLPFWGGYQVYGAFGPGETHGYFMARDARTGDEVCKVRTTWPVAAATLPTAGGIVFWAEPDGKVHASDARTCNVLWTDETDLGIRGSAITYMVDGKQYVALPTGWGGDIIGMLQAPRGHQLVVWALP